MACLPKQFRPFAHRPGCSGYPLYPALHLQPNDPYLLMQIAFGSQSSKSILHSSRSDQWKNHVHKPNSHIKGTLKSKYCIIIIFYINPIYKMSKIECMWKECIWKHISFNLKWEYMYSRMKKFFKSYQSRPVHSRVSLGWWFPGPPPAGCPWSWGSSWGAYWCCWWPLHPDATVVLPHHNYTSCR